MPRKGPASVKAVVADENEHPRHAHRHGLAKGAFLIGKTLRTGRAPGRGFGEPAACGDGLAGSFPDGSPLGQSGGKAIERHGILPRRFRFQSIARLSQPDNVSVMRRLTRRAATARAVLRLGDRAASIRHDHGGCPRKQEPILTTLGTTRRELLSAAIATGALPLLAGRASAADPSMGQAVPFSYDILQDMAKALAAQPYQPSAVSPEISTSSRQSTTTCTRRLSIGPTARSGAMSPARRKCASSTPAGTSRNRCR